VPVRSLFAIAPGAARTQPFRDPAIAMPSRWYSCTVKTTIDRSGRVVVPKAYRQRLGLEPGRELRLEETDGGLLITPVVPAPRVEETPGGPVIVPAETERSGPLTDEMVRDLLETGRS
jgi:AbrB family looped-hinge helix DNA binding protein